MIIDPFQSSFEPHRALISVRLGDGEEIVSQWLTSEDLQRIAEQFLVVAVKVRQAEAAQNQPDLFAVSDLLAGRV